MVAGCWPSRKSEVNKAQTEERHMNRSARIGIIGLVITLALNLIALLILKQPQSSFFSGAWWSTWFTSYAVWSVFTIVGLGKRRRSIR